MKNYTVSIVGSGNVAWHLARALEKAGHHIGEIYNRDIKKATQLVDNLYDAVAITEPDFRKSKASIILLAVSDDAIEEVCRHLILPPETVIAHTSGSRPLEALNALPNPKGVFYPLQTFSKGKEIDISQVPFCLEFDGDISEHILFNLATSLSNSVYHVDSQQRRVLHIAAVFACNFTNHLWTLSEKILEAEHLEFEMLKPLIAETVAKSLKINPQKAQTGPASRGDMLTIQQHLLYLQRDNNLYNIYKQLTDSILKS